MALTLRSGRGTVTICVIVNITCCRNVCGGVTKVQGRLLLYRSRRRLRVSRTPRFLWNLQWQKKHGGLLSQQATDEPCEKSFSTTSKLLGGFSGAGTESVATLDTGPTAKNACFSLPDHRNSVLEKFGFLPAQP